jgi:methyltransferase (TIGR00027 family)
MSDRGPSATAQLIARSLVLLAEDPRTAPLVPAEAAQAYRWFVEEALGEALADWQLRLARRGWGRALARLAEAFAIPGIRLHYAVRKLYLEELTRQALAQGIHQVVVVGAGFDTLALRLHPEFPQALFVEVDHPSTQRVKRRVLEPRGLLRDNLQLLPADLARRSLAEAVASLPEYRTDDATLLIAEGLTMYLREPDVDALFGFLWDAAGPGSRTAFTFLELDRRGRPSFPGASPLVRPWLRLAGEPFTWGVRRGELPQFLTERGCELLAVAGADELRERYLAPRHLAGERLAPGEYLCLAERIRT